MQIIPAIDIIDGKCVRLTEGDYTKKTEYAASPLEMAKILEGHGLQRLHVVDLDGAKNGRVTNWQSIEAIASQTSLTIDFGGGVKSRDDVKRIIDCGIRYVTVGSIAVKNQKTFEEWIEEFGSDLFFLGADVINEKIMVSGWTEQSSIDLIPFVAHYVEKGVRNIFCTDVSKDGKLEGPSVKLYNRLISAFPNATIVASGGVSNMNDVYALEQCGCSGVIIGKAIYENKITLEQLSDYVLNRKRPC